MAEGGSTLTQQLAKTIVGRERSFMRKVREFILAKEIESLFTKDEIASLYLNRVYFGRGAWGIENAARAYFHKHAKDPSIFEAALLAGIVQAPARLDPALNPQASNDRARTVLDHMVAVGSLNQKEAARALATDPQQGAVLPADLSAGHYMAWIARQLSSLNLDIGPKEEWRVSVSLDTWQQLAAKQATERWHDRAVSRNASEVALVSMGKDGMVAALIGGWEFRKSQFDRATQARRQPGSTFKPFVYLAALEAGYHPDSIIDDAPVTIGVWSPGNYDKKFLGRITLTEALAGSRNAATVRLARNVGFPRVAALAARFGLPSGAPPFVLGAEAVTLIDMTSAYASLAAGGQRVRPKGLIAVLDPRGRVRYAAARGSAGEAAKRPHVAALTLMLRAAARHSLGTSPSKASIFAGKSGTTQLNRDAWFIGFSERTVAGVWMGNDDESPMSGVAGSTLPALVWRDFMSSLDPAFGPRPSAMR